jgi:hypothetical protein
MYISLGAVYIHATHTEIEAERERMKMRKRAQKADKPIFELWLFPFVQGGHSQDPFLHPLFTTLLDSLETVRRIKNIYILYTDGAKDLVEAGKEKKNDRLIIRLLAVHVMVL